MNCIKSHYINHVIVHTIYQVKQLSTCNFYYNFAFTQLMLPCGPRARADLRQMGYNSLLFSFNIHFYGLDKLPILNIMKVRVWPWSYFDFIRINFSKLQKV